MIEAVEAHPSTECLSDERLVELVIKGERELFGFLYERYYRRTQRLAYGMTGSREAAEDLTQEIFLRVYEKLGQYCGQASFSTWFYRVAVNHCLNRSKQQRRQQRSDVTNNSNLRLISGSRQTQWAAQGQMAEPVEAGMVEANVLQNQIHAQVHQALLRLKPKMRLIVVLKDIEGLSYEEIAERTGCSKGTVASQLNRARKLLARKLEGLRGNI